MMKHTYPNRYQAKKDARYGDKIIKVEGGYVLMDEREYYVWRNQK